MREFARGIQARGMERMEQTRGRKIARKRERKIEGREGEVHVVGSNGKEGGPLARSTERW